MTSDGERFRGSIRFPAILRSEYFHMSTVVLSRALTSADDGTGTWDIVFTTADCMFNATLSIVYTITRQSGRWSAGYHSGYDDGQPAGQLSGRHGSVDRDCHEQRRQRLQRHRQRRRGTPDLHAISLVVHIPSKGRP